MVRAIVIGLVFAVVGPLVVSLLSYIGVFLVVLSPSRMSVEVVYSLISPGVLKKWFDVSFWDIFRTCIIGGTILAAILSIEKFSGPAAVLLFPTYALSPLIHRIAEQTVTQDVTAQSTSLFLYYVWIIRIAEWLVATWIVWKIANWISGKFER